jgi:hypothetical protein
VIVATIVISPYNVANFPEGGGHFWVYMQYVQGLRQLGCEVYWLERFCSSGDQGRDAVLLSTFFKRLEQYGLGGKIILYTSHEQKGGYHAPDDYIGVTQSEAEVVFRRADLLLNFHYAIAPALHARFRRTALVDIDPGLLQFWISTGQLDVPQHDLYFTIGETVGIPPTSIPDCGLPWIYIRPPVCLERWPYVYDAHCQAFTTVAGWWSGKWVKGIHNGQRIFYDNNKRVSFLEFAELPRLTDQQLELALYLADGDTEDRRVLESHGWRVHHSRDVIRSPLAYQSYIQRSRGEISCVKPSCIKFQNAWVSDRSLCYLASGKPVVVQNTGPSSFLPNGEGMFRFSTLSEAADALAIINANYERHCRAARGIAEALFDAKQVSWTILSCALH